MASPGPRAKLGARSGRVRQNAGRLAHRGHGRRHDRAIGFFVFLIMRVTTPQMTLLFTDLAYEDFRGDREGARPSGRALRAARRRQHRDGAEGPRRPAAHDVRRRRPAQGRRRRLRDFRQVGGARHHELRAEHQQLTRARGRTRPHHPLARSRPGRARASGDARPSAVLARQGRCHRVDRAQSPRHAGAASGPRDPPPRRRAPSMGCGRSGCRSSTSAASCSPTAPATIRTAATS